MNKKRIAGMAAIFLLATTVTASASQAGSQTDPVVTKSYVDNEIKKALSGSGNTGNSNTGTPSGDMDVEEIVDLVIARMGHGAGETFMAKEVLKGETLIAGEGTEFILRSGTAKAYSEVTDGISDVTDAKDIANGKTLKENHLHIVPRADGRGLTAQSNIWILVKGSYTIQ